MNPVGVVGHGGGKVLVGGPRSIEPRLAPISFGSSPRFSVSPWPSCPSVFWPQHLTVSSSSSAHEWPSPAETAATVRPGPRSTEGRSAPISPAASPRLVVSPWPSWPSALTPQHLTVSSSSRAHVWLSPAETAVAVRPDPRSTDRRLVPISVGLSPRSVVSPWPSWPSALSPQHLTVPLSSTVHVWLSPPEMAVAVRPGPRSTAGRLAPISPAASPRLVVSPRPSCPSSLKPQHFRVPSSSSAQVWLAPAVTAVAVRPGPRSTERRLVPISLASSPRLVVSPRPSCPTVLRPQHFTVPLSSSAQAWLAPAATAVAVRPGPRSTGRSLAPISAGSSPRSMVLPCPSWP